MAKWLTTLQLEPCYFRKVPDMLRLFAKFFLGVTAIGAVCIPMQAAAQELLVNRSFESAVTPTPVDGNNFYATIPNWIATNVTPAQPLPFNLIRPFAGYANNPIATPTGGGSIYFDVNAAAGILVQSISFPSAGMVDLNGWFSVRDNQQALSGLIINVRNSSNVVVATASTSFVVTDTIGTWKLASASNIPVAAGIHTFEVVLPNPANFDLASLVFKPALAITKTSVAISDPISLANPKMIPAAVAEYFITATSPAGYTVTNNSIFISDATPPNTSLVVSNIGGAGSGPASFTTGSSGLSYSFMSLASVTDDIEFSNNNGASWGYTPSAGPAGTDPAVTNIRLRPQGTMAASSTIALRIRYRLN